MWVNFLHDNITHQICIEKHTPSFFEKILHPNRQETYYVHVRSINDISALPILKTIVRDKIDIKHRLFYSDRHKQLGGLILDELMEQKRSIYEDFLIETAKDLLKQQSQIDIKEQRYFNRINKV